MTAYIYALVDPRYEMYDIGYCEPEVRYVGKSLSPTDRYYMHLKDCGTTRKCNWIKKLLKLGLKPELKLLQECDNYDWENAEIYWIAYYKELGHDLTNHTAGGDGINDPDGIVRKKLSVAALKRYEDPQERIKASSFRKGKKASIEVRLNMSEYRKGKKASDETRKRMSDNMIGNHYADGNHNRKGKKASEETRKKMSESQVERRDQVIGLNNPNSKFSREDILEIRELAKPIKSGINGYAIKRAMNLKDIAKKFGVCYSTIKRVINGSCYSDVY